ncbi:DNA internalization-related competence protein ComEC/Rec2 [Uliginosibacterium sp. 31-12]|uniref:DNA internalization-related competence protein ComEC/Rec2 n=1 Tax=Uliginosibacterium sp. 31-12 TaxID=3062781 RepID=UPI0026E1FC76|nr:DNA internalization-related competence protein ComEC/Rec2 [Uliginosibacterium sp. 31-12]MDO6386867.1 DNA internalization-related competence protein ComEC/Rec2 [Uliginosibacterium sp. 31-12]
MRLLIVFFALGIASCQLQANLQPWPFCMGCAAALVGVAMILPRKPLRVVTLWLAMALFGFAYANWRAELRLADRLAEHLEGQDLLLRGRIVGLPQVFERGLRFRLETQQAPAGVPATLMLSWYAQGRGELRQMPPAVHTGETWQLALRLRQPHASLNPHGFDYEGWLFEQGIGATGYVRSGPGNQRLEDSGGGLMARVDRWREQIRSRFERALPDAAGRGVLVALAVGDQAGIPSAQWELFRATGLTHAVSISGLHVTLIGALAGWFASWLWRRSTWLMLCLPAQKLAILVAALSAGAYVLLAGCGVPAQRTFYMLAVAALALWSGRAAGASRVMAAALLLVLLIDPWAVLSAGFWLSFGAVAALLLVARQQSAAGRASWRRLMPEWLRAQWAVSVLSLPLLLGLFQQFSLISPLTNALAIPLISMLITPLALGFAVLPLPSLAELAHWLLEGLLAFLAWCAASPLALWQQAAPPLWLVAVCALAALWALLPRGVPGRAVGLLSFAPLLLWAPLRPALGELDVNVLDVGQGLAVHLRTAQHDVLFDAGPQYGPEVDAGERIVLPWLRAVGTRKLDLLVVSHDDVDHSGGADSVLAAASPAAWRSSLSPDHALLGFASPHQACRQGEAWEWDGVHFEFLHPAEGFSGKDNELSCVLRVRSAQGSVLLTGDIPAAVETRLLQEQAEALASDILIVPHHGSRSSSTPDFIHATAARHAVFTAGYRNRYGHPAPDVLARYVQAGASIHRSDADGALLFRLRAGGIEVDSFRQTHARYWHDRTY